VALRLDDADPMDCFIAGLLHDFGKVVFAQFMPVQFKAALDLSQATQSSLSLNLRQAIGTDHSVVGAMLVEKWRFAPELVSTILNQVGPDIEDTDMIACVFAANQISKKLAYGFGGNPCVEEFPPMIADRLGGTLDEIMAKLGDLSPVYEEAKVFSRV
jgi:HD-like signal output (HDOD) protein